MPENKQPGPLANLLCFFLALERAQCDVKNRHTANEADRDSVLFPAGDDEITHEGKVKVTSELATGGSNQLGSEDSPGDMEYPIEQRALDFHRVNEKVDEVFALLVRNSSKRYERVVVVATTQNDNNMLRFGPKWKVAIDIAICEQLVHDL
ncbi:hypothetical protein P153DRAFT_361920 [Dothidotthia symphoricarpi CBS 119687]|uniref:Uncharacterized protein n=1 Tax=Dothidotthia symphoricarpi CBS 119687 TaxID=1392245 RepID=A0A6A5ZXF2_9PLEO|nr:uncharacterized protein P153DRAFT_361920 [Dothidotthia symphoricarpi CBS 119687]KAF2123594.1 hypothetical protein P153DRAFT_361920 [Dothidotthia symphoricarpi CBS 119687]